ncbi:MAG TPA: hypothetical protein VEL28_08995 [Candidatus Binatia bacterium]|nr:hypothetical protein [Candidatus Binatia bacterium]
MKFHVWGAATGLAALTALCLGSDAHARLCSLNLFLDDDVELGSIQLAVGHLSGTFQDPPCANSVDGAIAAFGADADAGRLDASFASVEGFSGPHQLALCTLEDPAGVVSSDDFNVVVVEATDVDGVLLETFPSVSLAVTCDIDSSTTTTTIEERICEVTFRLGSAGSIASLDYYIGYAGAGGDFAGSGNGVECDNLLPAGTLASYNDVESQSRVRGAMIHKSGIPTPADITRCRFLPLADDPVAEDFDGVVTNATDALEVQANPKPTLTASEIVCSGTGLELVCGDANRSGNVTASDSLRILEAALGSSSSCPLWVCDTDGSGQILANDALRALRLAIGLPVDMNCPPRT